MALPLLLRLPFLAEDVKADPSLGRALAVLDETLIDLNLPCLTSAPPLSDALRRCAEENVDRRDLVFSVDEPTVVLLSLNPDERLSTLLEGGRQRSESVFLVPTLRWLEKRSRVGGEATKCGLPPPERLFMRCGVTCDASGVTTLRRYSPPRLVTCVANFLTPAAAGGAASGTEVVSPAWEASLECPLSSSRNLEAFINDKLWTRLALRRVGCAIPFSVAISRRPAGFYDKVLEDAQRTGRLSGTIGSVSGIWYLKDVKDSASVCVLCELVLDSFLSGLSSPRFVIKPSGPLWMGSKLVSFWDSNSVRNGHLRKAALDEMVKVATALHSADSLLLDELLETMEPQRIVASNNVDVVSALSSKIAFKRKTPATGLLRHFQRARLFNAEDEDTEDEIEQETPQVAVTNKTVNDEQLAFRLRVIVARVSASEVVRTQICVCGIGNAKRPLNGDNTTPQDIETTLKQWGIANVPHVVNTIEKEAERAMRGIIELETRMSRFVRGARRAATDMIGIDFVLVRRQGLIIPFAIEVNDHDCTDAATMLELQQPQLLRGMTTRGWVHTMLMRSQIYALRGCSVAVIGGGGASKDFVWSAMKDYGVITILMDHDPNHRARELVEHFVCIPDMADHTKDDATASICVDALKGAPDDLFETIDGVLTFWEDCAPLAARVARRLGRRGNDPAVHDCAKSKYETHRYLWSGLGSKELERALTVAAGDGGSEAVRRRSAWGGFTPNHRPGAWLYAVRSVRVNSEEDVRAAIDGGDVMLPAVLKLEYGSSSVGVKLVCSVGEAVEAFHAISSDFVKENDHPGCGLSFSNTLVLMDYIDGSEFDCDLAMMDGQLLFAGVTSNGPTRVPYFCETAAALPAIGISDVQRQQIIYAARLICRELGLNDGVFNTEWKMTPKGPKLIEINARMGGFYIRDWFCRVYGVDLLRCALMIACNIAPVLEVTPEPRTRLVGLQLYSSQHSSALRSFLRPERLRDLVSKSDVGIILNVFEDSVPEPAEYEEPVANLACSGKTMEEASSKLLAVVDALGLDEGSDVPSSFYVNHMGIV